MRKALLAPAVPMSEINVTPLIDVMLVLLMVFMLSVPVLTHRIKLPINGAPPDHRTPIEPLRLRILGDGSLTLNDRFLPREALEAQLRFEVNKNAQAMLQVDAQSNARYGDITQVLATAKSAGLNDIGFKNIPPR